LSSLDQHLATLDGHAGLPFRRDCPICEAQRVAGSLAMGPVVPRTAKAGLAAAVLLASSAAAPVGAVAQKEPDIEYEGQVPESTAGGPGDQALDPEFDPGGGLPAELEAETDEAVDEGDPVEGDPDVDPVAQDELRQEQMAVPVTPTAPPTAKPKPDNADPPAPPLEGEQPAAAPPPVAREFVERAPGVERSRTASYGIVVRSATGTRTERAEAPRSAPSEGVPVETSSAASPASPTPDATGSRAVTPVPTQGNARDRHTVQPGDTLWSIARDLLGPNASAAAIAREVDRLWQLNADAIGTGDPNLIVAGQVLILR
jgi:LysM domain